MAILGKTSITELDLIQPLSNENIANNFITVNGTKVSLGGSITTPNTDTKVASSVSTSKAYLLGTTSSTNTTGTTVKNTNVYMSAGKLYVDDSEVASQATINNTVSGLTTVCNSLNNRISVLEDSSHDGYLTGVSGNGNGTVTFTREGLSSLTWDSSHSHAASAITGGTSGYFLKADSSGKGVWTSVTIPTIPGSLPANGGNADTVDNKHASDFAAASHTHDGYVSTAGGSIVAGTTNFNKIQISGANTSYGTGATLFFGDVESEVYIRNTADKDLTIYAASKLKLNGGSITINGSTPSIEGHTHAFSDLTSTGHTHSEYASSTHSHAASAITGGTSGYFLKADSSGKGVWTSVTIPTIPGSLPANGGNADTVDNKHASDFAAASHSHSEYLTECNLNNHYTPNSSTTITAKTSGADYYITGVTLNVDSKGHVTAMSVDSSSDDKGTSTTGNYLPLSGGTLIGSVTGTTMRLSNSTQSSAALTIASGSIIMPGNNSANIRPATNNYGSIGTSTYAFYRGYINNITASTISATTISASTAFYQTSDEQLKDFCNEIEVDFDKLKNIPKSYFTWKSDEDKKLQIGTSAQKVKELYPELVGGTEEDTLCVDYSKLSIVALKAIDVLHDENEKLKSIIEKMDERIAQLEKKLEE